MEHEGATAAPPGGRPPTDFQRLSRRHDAALVRAWARSCGIEVSPTGGLPRYVYDLYEKHAREAGA